MYEDKKNVENTKETLKDINDFLTSTFECGKCDRLEYAAKLLSLIRVAKVSIIELEKWYSNVIVLNNLDFEDSAKLYNKLGIILGNIITEISTFQYNRIEDLKKNNVTLNVDGKQDNYTV